MDEIEANTNRTRIPSVQTENHAGVEDSKFELCDINSLVRTALEVIDGTLSSKIRVSCEFEAGVFLFTMTEKLNIVLLNLLNNAVFALGDEGRLFVKTENKGGWVFISVSDSGSGIPSKNISKVFDPFFSTWGREGLGLFVAQVLMKQLHGKIIMENNPEGGLHACIALPKKE